MNNGELLSVLEHIERETARELCEPEGSLSATQSSILARKKPLENYANQKVPRDAIHNRLQGQGVI